MQELLLETGKQIDLSNRARQEIWGNDAQVVDVPGQGRTWVARIRNNEGEEREMGWSRIRDERGALVWSPEGESLEDGDYSVMYVDPYTPSVRLAELRAGGEIILGIDSREVEALESILPPKR